MPHLLAVDTGFPSCEAGGVQTPAHSSRSTQCVAATLVVATMASEGKQYEITVAGRINDPAFQQARVLARFLATENSNVTTTAVAMVESDWEAYVTKKGRVRRCRSPLCGWFVCAHTC